MPKKYILLSVKNGIAVVKHRCWFCKRKHRLEYPLDDVGTKNKINSLCLKCENSLEHFKKNNPEIC
jgi:hypothetical protein